MTHRERELLEALKHVVATSDPKTARFALRVLGTEAGPVLFRSGLAGEVDRGFDEIDRALGAGTTSADIQRYANALDGHYYFRLTSIGDETRWCARGA
jgi:hypothetical protein